jgi:hypothetical protein
MQCSGVQPGIFVFEYKGVEAGHQGGRQPPFVITDISRLVVCRDAN